MTMFVAESNLAPSSVVADALRTSPVLGCTVGFMHTSLHTSTRIGSWRPLLLGLVNSILQ